MKSSYETINDLLDREELNQEFNNQWYQSTADDNYNFHNDYDNDYEVQQELHEFYK